MHAHAPPTAPPAADPRPSAYPRHRQSFALRYPACSASASVANGTTDAGFMPAYPLQPGTRYTLLCLLPWTSPSVVGTEEAAAGGTVVAARVYGCACSACIWILASYAVTSSGASLMTRRFSAFCCSAAFVKLNDPVRIVAESITMTLLWAMACWASMRVWMPTLLRNVAAL